MTHRLQNKIALITGASRGIGESIAKLFHAEGAIVILSDILDGEGQQLAKKLGERAHYYHLDVSDEKNWQEVIASITKKLGQLNILINNAGIIGVNHHFSPQNPEDLTLEDWEYIQKINSTSIFLGCKYGISLMKKTGGSIINMSSRSGIVGIPNTCAYAASKAAIRNYTKSVALYCAQKNYAIRCNSIHPAAILTPLWEPLFGDDRETAIQKISAGIPLGKMGEAIDVAYMTLYLASDEAKFVTGSEFTIDGGILAGSAASPQK